MKFHHATPIVCPVLAARKSRRTLFALVLGLFSIVTPTALKAAVYDFSPIDGGAIQANPSANGVLLSVNGNNQLNVPTGVPNFIRNHNGVVAWSVNGTVYSYVFDPGRSNWVGTSSSHGVTISDLNSTDGIVAWSVENALQGSAHYRVYDPARGAWVSQSGPGPIEENRILNTNGVVAWSVGSTAYGRVYDPTRNGGEWRPFAANLTGPTSDLITSDGVVAWSSLNVTATIGFRVYDPGRGEWQGNTASANSVTSLRITNSQVSWKTPTFVTRGYDPATAMWGTAPVPLAYFAVSTNAGNAPLVVSFVDMSIGANSWSWSFGDGPGSSLKRSPGYRYTTFGRFTAAQNASRPGASPSSTTRTILADITLPVGTNRINGGATFTTNPVVALSPSATDNSGVVTDMRFSNTNNANWSNWEPLASSKTWTLSAGNGVKTVYAQFRDIAVNTSATVSATIALDTTAPPIVSFVNVAVSEAAGLATVQVTLDHSLGRDLSIRYSTSDGTATAPGDYTATSAVLVFPSNTTSRTFTVPIAVDSLVEPNETIQLLFSDPTNCVPGLPGTITILDNDVASVAFAATNFNVIESNGVANVVVRLNAASGQAISVDYLVTNGTATAGADFTATNGTLFFAPGQIEQSFQVPIVSDTVSEFSETILVSLGNPTNATLAAPVAATVTIQDDDLPLLYFSKASYPVSEGAGAVMIEVQLSKPFASEAVFNYSVFGGTATPGGSGDYLASNGRLSIIPNTTNQFFFVNLVDNGVIEPAETVHMTLSGITGATPGPRMEADVLILDDDGPPVIVTPHLTTNSQFQITFLGAPGQVFRLHFSTNLPIWQVEALLTNTPSGLLEYSRPNSGLMRFYRTSVP